MEAPLLTSRTPDFAHVISVDHAGLWTGQILGTAVSAPLIPDNTDIRRRVAERMGAGGYDAHSLLGAIWRDCVGALKFLPEDSEPPAMAIDGRKVTDAEIATIIANLARSPLGLGDDQEFRISIAGAQEKTGLLLLDGRWHVPHGATPTTHIIIKPQLGVVGLLPLFRL